MINWVITGRKTFTTMSPVLDYFVVSAAIAAENEIGNFLIHKECTGLTIDETWDDATIVLLAEEAIGKTR